jgi:hypothetical protein
MNKIFIHPKNTFLFFFLELNQQSSAEAMSFSVLLNERPIISIAPVTLLFAASKGVLLIQQMQNSRNYHQ